MQDLKKLAYIVLAASIFTSCGHSGKDSTAKADSTNSTKDSADKVHPASFGQEISGDDASFAVKAAAGGLTEVELGKLAQQKGSTQAVRNFGAMMVKDHSAANEELKELAKSKHIVLPEKLGDDGSKLKSELSAKSGLEFDKAYAEAMVEDHVQDTSDFVRGIKIAKYPEMTAFAKKTLPLLKMHLMSAEKIKAQLNHENK